MNHLGYYGKLRHRGDFVRFNLPGTFVDVWDDWMRGLLVEAERLGGADWAARHDEGRAWRFALSRGVAGTEGWFGVMAASADKVGRRFPFALAAQLPHGTHPAGAASALASRFEALESAVADALDGAGAFDALQDRLRSIASDPDATASARVDIEPRDPGADDGGVGVRTGAARALAAPAGAAALLDGVLVQTFGVYSVWSGSAASGESARAPTEGTLVVRGLPRGATGATLFGGDRDDDGCARVVVGDGRNEPDRADDRTESEPGGESAVPDDARRPTDASDEAQDMLSTGDWSALEAIPDSAPEPIASAAPSPPPVPEKEPLVLEDDAEEDAPWER